MKNLFLGAILFFSFHLEAKAEKPDKKNIDFEKPVILKGSSQSLKNSCVPGFGRPAKLFNEFLKLQTILISLYKEINKNKKQYNILHSERQRLTKKSNRLVQENNKLTAEWNHLTGWFFRLRKEYGATFELKNEYDPEVIEKNRLEEEMSKVQSKEAPLAKEQDQHVSPEHERLAKEYNRLRDKRDSIYNKINLLQFDSMRLQKMFYLSLRLEGLSMYSLKELVNLFKKQIPYVKKLNPIYKKQISLLRKINNNRKKQLSIFKKWVSLRRRQNSLLKKKFIIYKKWLVSAYPDAFKKINKIKKEVPKCIEVGGFVTCNKRFIEQSLIKGSSFK